MADNYKILAQTTAASIEENTQENQANVIYTVPANTKASISSISLINTSVTAENYYLGVVKAEDVAESNSTSSYSYTTQEPEGRVVAFASSMGTAAYSDDGLTWQSLSIPFNANWTAAAYGNGKFVALSVSGYGAYSEDGVTFTVVSVPSANFRSIAYNGEVFIAVANSDYNAYISTDGITWNQSLIGSNGAGFGNGSNAWIAYGDGKFIVVQDNSSNVGAYSIDNGQSWTQITLPYSGAWSGITYGETISGDGVWVAVAGSAGYAGTIVSSLDGINWNIPIDNGPYFRRVVFGNGTFVAIALYSSEFYVSSNGANWTGYNGLPSESGLGWEDIVFNSVLNGFIRTGLGSSSYALFSDNGINWQLVYLPSQASWVALASKDIPEILATETVLLPNISDKQTIIPNRSIEPNQVDEIVGGITLSAGDQIRVYSDSPELTVQVYGVEIA